MLGDLIFTLLSILPKSLAMMAMPISLVMGNLSKHLTVMARLIFLGKVNLSISP